MVDSKRLPQSRDPLDRFDEAISDPRLYGHDRYERPYEPPYEQPYEQPYSLSYDPPDAPPEEPAPNAPVPLFLSNYEDEFQQQLSQYTFASGSRKFASGSLRKSRVPRIAIAVVSIAAIGAVLALFSLDSTRAVIFQASLGGGGAPPVQAVAAPPALATQPPQPPPAQQRVAAPPVAAEAPAPQVAAARRSPADAMALASPTRDEIAAAYQSAAKGKVAAHEPATREAAREAAPVAPVVRETMPINREILPARRIDPDELAALLKRAKGLLAIGDITSARLLLERAADAHEAEAALMLAGTYDSQVLGSQDMRSVAADPAAAQAWYQKAAQLGSADAQRRLGQLQR
jgi:hypothetical protein